MDERKRLRLANGLDSDQHKAVTSGAQRLLVVAGAGSGKTRTFVHRIAELVRKGADPASILALSYTREAAGEVARRLEAMEVHGVVCTTIHAWCHREPLRSFGHLIGHASYDILDAEGSEEVLARDLGLGEWGARRAQTQITLVKNFTEEVKRSNVVESYDAILASRNQFDFDDLQVKTLQLLQEHPEVALHYRSRISHLLVDEYQDINPVQHAIVKLLCAPVESAPTPTLTAVGDPDQSIYGFRGAEPSFIVDFLKEYPDARRVMLGCNYRSTGLIVKAADAVVRVNNDRITRKVFTRSGDGAPVELVGCEDEVEEAEMVARRVRELLEAGTSPGEVAVLYRFHKQAEPLVEAMVAEGVAFDVEGGDEVLQAMSTSGGVRLGTIHGAKGLEWEAVFLPGWADGTMPSYRARSEAEVAEERRVAYVAITRAKRRAVISWPTTKWANGNESTCSPSRFVEQVRGVAQCRPGEKVGARG